MSLKNSLKVQFDYHWHTTRHLLEGAAKIEPNSLNKPDQNALGSIHEIFFHLLQAGYSWRMGLETGSRQSGIEKENYPDLSSIAERFEAEALAWVDYFEGLSEEDIAGEITLSDRRGNPRTFPLWQILQHLMLHGMQHHSELAQRLTDLGHSPGDLDFIFFRTI